MRNKLALSLGLVVLALLATGAYIYAMDGCKGDGKCKVGEEKCDSQSGGGCGMHNEKGAAAGAHQCKGDNPNCPNCLMTGADKLIQDASKSKDSGALAKQCGLMITKALGLVTESNALISGGNPDMAKITANSEMAAKLLMKSAQLSAKCQTMMPKTDKKAAGEAAAVYTCPMHPEVVSDKVGSCPKCGMDLVKK